MDVRSLIPFFLATALLVSCGCTGQAPQPAPVSAEGAAPATPESSPGNAAPGSFAISVDSLTDGSTLPSQYTCIGAAESPEISWTGVPNGTVSLALLLEDPDAPSGTFTHWLLYNIPPDSKGIPADISAAKELDAGEKSGRNSAGSRGYYPPCPPIGTTHRYIFRLYALDEETGLAYATREDFLKVSSGHMLAESDLTTRFGR